MLRLNASQHIRRSNTLHRVWLTAVTVLALTVPLSSRAQDKPSADRLLGEWQTGQARTMRSLAQIELSEFTEKVFDGPFGPRRHRIQSRISGDLRSNVWSREVLSFEKDGHSSRDSDEKDGRDREHRHHDDRRRRAADDRDDLFLQKLLMPQSLLDGMKPAGPVIQEALDGTPALRFDVTPEAADKHQQIQRITVWLHSDQHVLLHTRTIVQQPDDRSSLVVATDYERQSGLDVPRRRTIKGTMQYHRRLRTFTLLVDINSAFSDYRFLRP